MQIAWEKVFDRWRQHEVPLIGVRTFDPKQHYDRAPWVDRKSDRPCYLLSNPIKDTGWYLIQAEVRTDPELCGAFMLHAFGTMYSEHMPIAVREPIKEALCRLSGGVQVWHGTAKNVMPVVSLPRQPTVDWPNAVDLAARAWIEVAERYAVVRTPHLMEPDTDEYRQYIVGRDLERRRTEEESERREYERLKAKFEGQL